VSGRQYRQYLGFVQEKFELGKQFCTLLYCMHKNVYRTLYLLLKKVFVRLYFQCTRKKFEKIKRYERHQHCTKKSKFICTQKLWVPTPFTSVSTVSRGYPSLVSYVWGNTGSSSYITSHRIPSECSFVLSFQTMCCTGFWTVNQFSSLKPKTLKNSQLTSPCNLKVHSVLWQLMKFALNDTEQKSTFSWSINLYYSAKNPATSCN
jgi:hypothetical protein